MGVSLKVISGVLLILIAWSKADERQWRQIREAPPPNTTEINNRDLNKILKVDPKTEFLETKPPKLTNNLSGLPLKLGKNHYKLESTSASSQNDSQTNWTQKSSTVFDLEGFQGTRHPSFDTNTELTTPSTKFDNKFHETVKSVKLKVDFDNDDGGNNEEDENEDDDGEEEEDSDVAKKGHGQMEFEKTKTIVDNETVSKNSIHKDLSIEQTMKINYKNVYNESEVYDQEIIEKNGTTEKIDRTSSSTIEPTVTIPTTTTKSEILPIIDNNIASESMASLSNVSKPVITTTTESTLTVSLEDNIILPSSPSLKKSEIPLVATPYPTTTTTLTTMTTTVIPSTTTEEVPTTIQVETETTTIAEELATTTILSDVPATSESFTRTSKSLDNSIVAEQSISDSSVKQVEVSQRSVLQDLVTTTAVSKEEVILINNTINKVDDEVATTTTTEVNTEAATTILPNISETTTVEEKTTEVLETTTTTTTVEAVTEETTQVIETTQVPTTSTTQPPQTTTEISFVDNEENISQPTTTTTVLPTTNPSVSSVPVIRMVDTSSEIVIPDVSPRESEAITEDPTTIIETTTEAISSEEEYIKEDSHDGDTKKKIAAIVISSVCAVCLVLLAGLLHIMRKRQKRLNYGPRCRPVSLDDYSIDNLSVYNSVRHKGAGRRSKHSFGNPAFEDPVATSHPLNFPALAKFSANLEDIKAEFEDIPQISARTSELPEGCDTKNRYANVIPLPETRVFLNTIDGYPNSDYINANYVTGPNNTKGYYIATQGPMQNTVDDFWRMIWEQQAKVILMLTHLVENGLEKCVDYLPESEVLECSRMFGDFQITLKKREVKDKYIISGLQLKNMVSNSWREITHFWYLGWPEKGVPSEANSLIAFIIEARSYMKNGTLDKTNTSNGLAPQNDHSPVVVHCSPGTGRTGVVIACDIAIREFEKTRLVDIPKIVYKIRRDRANAVQTKEQYIFIYKVVNLYATKLTGGALENL